MVAAGIGEQVIKDIEAEERAAVAQAIEFARASPFPDYAQAFDDTFGERLPLPQPLASG